MQFRELWVTMATAAILNFFNSPKAAHTTVDIPTKFHEVSWKESKFVLNSPFFCFHGNYGTACPTDSDFFGLSRSTRCGCYSYQVSSISVRRVTRYDNFCAFQFFSILAVSMATAAILKKNQPLPALLHMAYDIPTRFHKVWSRHLREIKRTKMCGRIIRRIIIVKKNRRITQYVTRQQSGWRNNKKRDKNNLLGRLNYLTLRSKI